MKLVYAHRWMLQALDSAQIPRTYLLEPSKLLGTLSPDDVASYILANEVISEFVPEYVITSFKRPKWDLENAEMKRVKDAYVRAQVNRIKAEPAEASQTDFTLSCELLGPDAILIYHIPQVKPFERKEQEVLHFAERLLRQLYTTLKFEQLVVLPIMRRYMEARQMFLTPNHVVAR